MDRPDRTPPIRLPSAPRVLAIAIALGVAGQLLLHGHALGVNVPIAAGPLLLSLVAITGIGRIDPLDAWIPVTAMLLAGAVAIRDDGPLVALDVLGALGLCAASAPALAGESVTRRTTAAILLLAARVMAAVSVGAAPLLDRVRHETAPADLARPGRRALPVIRGLVLVLPLLVVFAGLFAAADPIFGQWLDRLTAWDVDLGDSLVRALYAATVAWVAGGLLWLAWSVSGRATPEPRSLGAAASAPAVVPGSWRLGVTEALTVLVALDLLFAAFVALQVAYLFGGLSTMSAIGMTYSTYARRGFFELAAVVVLVGGLLMGLESVVAHRTRAFVAAALTLVGLTSVVLASSWLRLGLYEEAYGWTELRFYVAAAIVFLAICLVAAAVLIWRNRAAWLPHAVAAASLVVLLGVNVVGPQAFITQRNLERSILPASVPSYGDPSLDAPYLRAFDADAIPALIDALPRLDPEQRDQVEALLHDARARLDRSPDAWQSWNLGRWRAREALEAWAAR